MRIGLQWINWLWKILDVGCGIGSFEHSLPSLNIIGLDSSKEMLEEARKRSDKIFVLGNVEHLEIEDSAFDAVFTVTTLEFLDDYQTLLNGSGYFFVSFFFW